MPVQSWGHVQYWEVSSTVVTPVVAAGGYPTWQAAPLSQVLGFGLGGMLPWVERMGTRLRWAWRVCRIILGWDEPRRQALTHAIEVLNDARYPHAVLAVKMTAVTPEFSGPAAWKAFGRALHDRPTWAENQWRHLKACDHADQMMRADGSTISNPDRALMVELAYHSFAQHAAGSTKA